MSDFKRVWERRHDESAAQFAGFRCFLNLRGKRTIEAAWREYSRAKTGGNGQSKTKSSGQFRLWAKAFAWQERADAHDETRRRLEAEAQRQTRMALHRQRAAQYRAIADKAMRAIEAKIEACDGVKLLELLETVRYFDLEHQNEAEIVNLQRLRAALQNDGDGLESA